MGRIAYSSPKSDLVVWMVKTSPRSPEAITKGRLTHEMAAPVGKMDVGAWQLLFEDMPIGALLRNLGSLTEIGVLAYSKTSKKNLTCGINPQ